MTRGMWEEKIEMEREFSQPMPLNSSAPAVKIVSFLPQEGELTYLIGDKKYVASGVSPFLKKKVDQFIKHGANGKAIEYLKKFEVSRVAAELLKVARLLKG